MKKFLKTLTCAIALIIMALSMAACNNGDESKQLEELQSQLVQQQEQLQRLEELLEQQQEQLQRLEKLLEQQQEKKDRLENATPYKATMGFAGDSVWCKFTGSYLFCSAEQGISFLKEVEKDAYNPLLLDWHMRTENGIIDEDFFNNYFVQHDNKVLVMSVFYTPCIPATVTRHYLYKHNNKLFVEIDYECGDSTAVAMFTVIMEVDKNYIEDVTEVVLELNK